MKIVEKPWGKEEILEINDKYVVKRLTMNAGCKCSLQYHKEKRETIYVLKGPLFVHKKLLKGKDVVFDRHQEGEFFTIEPGIVHRMEAKFVDAIYLECSTPQLDDVVRLEDDYHRK